MCLKVYKNSIDISYCELGYKMKYFEDDDDDQAEMEISNNTEVISKYLKEIEQKLWENH